jgi:hypothetical protein
MSNLWRQAGPAWEAIPFEAELAEGTVRLVRFGSGSDTGVALLMKHQAEVRINGLPILGGLHILQHRDELLIDGKRFYFSAESTPILARFQLNEGARQPTCPVCRGPLQDEEQAIQCPGCGRWFHQITEAQDGRRPRTCWTYAATCRFCQHPTALDGATSWRPEHEEEPHEA